MKVTTYLREQYVFLDVDIRDKDALFHYILEKLRFHPDIANLYQVEKDLNEREAKGSTGLGSGIAMPHARTEGVRDIVILFIRPKFAFDYESPNGPDKARLIFFLAVPKDKIEEYLEIVGALMRILKRDSVREKLIAISGSKEVCDFLRGLEGDAATGEAV